MKFNCKITEKELKKILLRKRSKTNVIYLTLFSILFLVICFQTILNNLLFMAIVYIISLIVMLVLLHIINIIFTNISFKINNEKGLESYGDILVETDNESIVEKGDFSSFRVDFKDVIYSRFKKNYFILVDKKVSLLLKKSFFSNDKDFDELSKFVKEKVKGR